MIDVTCKTCGAAFRAYPSNRRVYCTTTCADIGRHVADDVACRKTLFTRRKAAHLTRPARKYTFNEAFFSDWSDDLAWLLGLIWSDGCLQGTSVIITSKDHDLLATVADLISHSHGPRLYNQGRHWSLLFSSSLVSQFLRTLGLTESKSLTANWPQIPEYHRAAFVRGLLDGDGSVILSHTRRGQQVANGIIAWCGAAPDVRDGLLGWLNSMALRPTLTHRADGNLWKIRLYHQESIRRLWEMLYPSLDVPCLARKRDKYAYWIATPRARAGRPYRLNAPVDAHH